ncbi:hypothetical protein WJX84_006859 [Apatococcus fuscideae]|uniref:Ribosomal RNA-processing protein 40 n=1 Tax=Apatococcus fuscideae TaxID=2026836 RepID=A0AAW1TEV3_9CHLO
MGPQPARVVAPGDSVYQLPEKGEVRVGSGIHQDGQHLITCRPGLLSTTQSGKVWVAGRQKRYIPQVGDCVLGRIADKHSENYGVDINTPFPASLPVLAFEGATRRSRPNLQVGDLVYARVTAADRDVDPELVCTDASGKAAGFGAMTGGQAFRCTTSFAAKLLSQPTPAILTALGRALQFELAVGLNGHIWVHSPKPTTTIIVTNTLPKGEFLSDAQAEMVVKRIVSTMQ